MTVSSSLICNAHKAYVLCGACIISFSAVWVKISNVPPTTSAYYRVFFGFLFLLGAAAANLPWRYRKRALQLTGTLQLFSEEVLFLVQVHDRTVALAQHE